MKKDILMIAILSLFSLSVFTGNGMADEKEEAAIKKLITEAYVNGLINAGDLEPTKKGFDPGFNLLMRGRDDKLGKWPIADWIKNVEKKKEQNPDGPKEKFTVKFVFVDVTQDAAVAKVELTKSGKHIYSDYLSLYKFKSGWRIVSKIYYEHN